MASGRKPVEIEFAKSSKLFLECDYLSNKPFGMQTLGVSEKMFGDEYGAVGARVPIKDKYVFAEGMIEGEATHLGTRGDQNRHTRSLC